MNFKLITEFYGLKKMERKILSIFFKTIERVVQLLSKSKVARVVEIAIAVCLQVETQSHIIDLRSPANLLR